LHCYLLLKTDLPRISYATSHATAKGADYTRWPPRRETVRETALAGAMQVVPTVQGWGEIRTPMQHRNIVAVSPKAPTVGAFSFLQAAPLGLALAIR